MQTFKNTKVKLADSTHTTYTYTHTTYTHTHVHTDTHTHVHSLTDSAVNFYNVMYCNAENNFKNTNVKLQARLADYIHTRAHNAHTTHTNTHTHTHAHARTHTHTRTHAHIHTKTHSAVGF